MTLLEARAKDWTVRVKPQGRKNVRPPITKGISRPLNFFSSAIDEVKDLGSEKLIKLAHLTFSICSPRINIISETRIVRTEPAVKDKWKKLPKYPNSPPNIVKNARRPKLKINEG
jgi:hypothetical protein